MNIGLNSYPLNTYVSQKSCYTRALSHFCWSCWPSAIPRIDQLLFELIDLQSYYAILVIWIARVIWCWNYVGVFIIDLSNEVEFFPTFLWLSDVLDLMGYEPAWSTEIKTCKYGGRKLDFRNFPSFFHKIVSIVEHRRFFFDQKIIHFVELFKLYLMRWSLKFLQGFLWAMVDNIRVISYIN